MDVTSSPINLTPSSSTPPQAAGVVTGASQSGVISVADLFAALLTQQLGQQPALQQSPLPGATTESDLSKGLASMVFPDMQTAAKSVPESLASESPKVSKDVKADAKTDEQSVDPLLLAAAAPVQQVVPSDPVPLVAPVVSQVVAPVVNDATPKAAVSELSRGGVSAANAQPASVTEADSQQLQRQPVAAAPASFAVAPSDIRPEVVAKVAVESKQSTELPQVFVPPVSAAVQPVMQPVTVQPSSSIPQPVGHSAWGDTLGDRVVWMVGQQHQGVDLHLNPPALGPLEVRLSMNDGQANLTFSTQHVNVKEAIENATPRLREMLGDSGISLGSVSVNVGSFTQQQPQQQGRGSQPGTSWSDVPPIADFSNAITGTSVPLSRNGMVDTFA